jgi:hypothetical protein
MRPYLEKSHHKKKAGGVAQGVVPEFKPQYHKKKKKKEEGFILVHGCLTLPPWAWGEADFMVGTVW